MKKNGNGLDQFKLRSLAMFGLLAMGSACEGMFAGLGDYEPHPGDPESFRQAGQAQRDGAGQSNEDPAENPDDPVVIPPVADPGNPPVVVNPPPAPPPVTPPSGPQVVSFVIPAGTGNNPWNTAANPIRVKVGDTLRVTNNDNVNRRIHTNGNPFPHGATIAPGASVNYTIQSRINTVSGANNVYDHNAGTGARIYIIAE